MAPANGVVSEPTAMVIAIVIFVDMLSKEHKASTTARAKMLDENLR